MRKLLVWLDHNLLFLLSLFLLAFIPLFPKLPLFDALPGYMVRVRLEDFFVLLTFLVWIRDVWKKRILWNIGFFGLVCLYAVMGAISILFGTLILNTIPRELLHLGKSGLHLFRYLEYFTLFFFFVSSLRTKKQLLAVIAVLIATLLGVVGYGLGQKYLHFPVYSTMNREYSKGEKLSLEQGARPQSTFAGHYDLAAYLVIVLPLIVALLVGTLPPPLSKAKVFSLLGLGLALGAGILMLFFTGSKTSIMAFGLGGGAVLLLNWLKLPSKKLRLRWGMAFLITALILGSLTWIILPSQYKDKVIQPVRKLFVNNQDNPVDLVGDGYEMKTKTTVQPDGSVKKEPIRVKSTWSPNALKYGLSMGIRLDTLWPQALLGFARSPLTGSGYGTLAKLDSDLFIEADSTDNNYLRTLGETGILGFLSFYGILAYVFWVTYQSSKGKEKLPRELALGFCGSMVGLFFSAMYLDVFAASKVAFVFWALAGTIFAFSHDRLQPIMVVIRYIKKFWPFCLALVLALFLWHQNPFLSHTPTKDLNELTGGVEQIASARCYLRTGILSLCRNSGLTSSLHITLYALFLIPFLRLFNLPESFYFLNLALMLGGLLVSFIVLRHRIRPFYLFMSLVTGVSLAAIVNLSARPFSQTWFALAIFGLPAVVILVGCLLEALRHELKNIFLKMVLLLVVVCVTYSILFNHFLNRYRNSAPNDAFTAVRIANGILDSSPQHSVFLATLLNPYFVDFYALNKYSLLPLSLSQPYAHTPEKIWGIAGSADLTALYSSLISSSSLLYVSDYGINQNQNYLNSFNAVKQNFDLTFVSIGCEERCNLYAVRPYKPVQSVDIASTRNTQVRNPGKIPPSYQFAVINNRYLNSNTRSFVKKLTGLINTPQEFVIVSGDLVEKPYVGLLEIIDQQFSSLVSYPILFSAGNNDLVPEKDAPGGYQEFFTSSEYFILLDIASTSRLSQQQQLNLYTSLLKLEKLPQIKTLFIIAHDLNWQDNRDPLNATHVLERKLQAFPYIKTFVLTADHDVKVTDKLWFKTGRSSNGVINYVAGLVDGSNSDAYVQIVIGNDKSIGIKGVNLRPSEKHE